jgi:hypothetical protein
MWILDAGAARLDKTLAWAANNLEEAAIILVLFLCMFFAISLYALYKVKSQQEMIREDEKED